MDEVVVIIEENKEIVEFQEPGCVLVSEEIVLQEKNVTPTTSQQNVIADSGYKGLSKVVVDAVTSEIDSNIIPDNIKNGVNILGVDGAFVGGKYAPRSIAFYKYAGTNLDYELSNLDTSNMISMASMFYYCSSVTNLDLSNFNTNNVTNMASMFASCSFLKSLDLSNFNTSNVTDMSYMFNSCSQLKTLDLSSFNTSKVTNMNTMFNSCSNLTSLDLSSFDTSEVTNMSYMFSYTGSLKTLDIRNFTFDKVKNYTNIFNGLKKDCLIIVKGTTEKEWVLARRSDLTNVKTIAEL